MRVRTEIRGWRMAEWEDQDADGADSDRMEWMVMQVLTSQDWQTGLEERAASASCDCPHTDLPD